MILSPFSITELELISIASNIKGVEGNPAFTKEDFLGVFPQFTDKVPDSVLTFYLQLANSSLSYARWRDSWKMGMVLFIAHYLTLYLQATAGLTADSPVSQVISNSLAQGQVASKSAGSLSKSYDYGSVNEDFMGWGAWKLTLFGQQFVPLAKLVGKGGSYIW